MSVNVNNPYSQLVQPAAANDIKLIRINTVMLRNIYYAETFSLDANGYMETYPFSQIYVRNIAESSDSLGRLTAGTMAMAYEFEGWWSIFVLPPKSICFIAKIEESLGNNSYLVREQKATSNGRLAAMNDSAQIPACNAAEMVTVAVPPIVVGTYVTVFGVADSGYPARLHYFFNHPL
jgi:hypothetical protein